MKTIIMAGGKGSRISELYPNIPKPMIPIDGVPVLEREIISLRDQGFKDFIITISHMGHVIMEHFNDGSQLGVNIEYFNEKVPLGNAGALFKLKDKIGESPFLLINADAVFDVDFNRMVDFHYKHDGLVTLFTHPNSHPYDSGLIVADDNGRVIKWITKEDVRPKYYKNRVNAGLHVIDPKVLDLVDVDIDKIGSKDMNGNLIKVDLDRQILKPLQDTGKMYCYDSPEYVKDMGTPSRFYSVVEDFKSGHITSKNLNQKQKAVFLDRDGTINVYKGFLRNIDDFELLSGVSEAIKEINSSGYLCIVITNQPVIARGEITFEQLNEIHNKLETLLGLEGAYIDGIYFCPHHPDRGYKGEIPELKFNCDCRKPKPGMLFKAAKDYNIDLTNSYMVGDGLNDIKAGISAGCKTILISEKNCSPHSENFGQSDNCSSVLEFVKKYINVKTSINTD
ncbi:D-glycero-beta-D-manno-heptose 1,7-bisphosphate 7-phosphatase [Agathobacter rectalis]|jgi:D,D-heptose 1,7-bisphosphate phosphatase|uniref:D,D-heptose 1,7-bisphosphate phosphatase n=1 Tax=Agathobacter rectalis TaxID=39491 RepID=A0A414A0K8_9FIRM|nr:D-glycero-beta-D-manno-heptose 1,7-bisphosphate 7-phosphatase [Agathobacter rectalis]RHC38893.1 D-glycero-beta-D-manno-heptose 1,7-bisphosphate 7-phosphatase [Agathobacter rectalis]